MFTVCDSHAGETKTSEPNCQERHIGGLPTPSVWAAQASLSPGQPVNRYLWQAMPEPSGPQQEIK